MTTDHAPIDPTQRGFSERLPAHRPGATQEEPKNTKPFPSILDSFQIQKLDAENDEKQAQNDAKPAKRPAKKRGPKTKRGKDAAARRSTKHGILSNNPVIRGMERKRDWEAHLKGVIENLQAEGRLENQLAYRIALALWQLERLDRYVQAVTDDYMDNPRRNTATDDIMDGVRNILSGVGGQLMPERYGGLDEAAPGRAPAPNPEQRVIPEGTDLKKIIRYEAHLHRLIDKNLRSLEALQLQRRGEKMHYVRHL